MEINYWRRFCRFTRLDRVRNDDIRMEIGFELDIMDTIGRECQIRNGQKKMELDSTYEKKTR